jgi:hypothetical protein
MIGWYSLAVLSLAAVVLAPLSAASQRLYRCVDSDGRVSLSNDPPSPEKCVDADAPSPTPARSRHQRPPRPRAPSPHPRPQAITPPALHAAPRWSAGTARSSFGLGGSGYSR